MGLTGLSELTRMSEIRCPYLGTLLTLCVLLQGSLSTGSDNQLALLLYYPINQSSTTENLSFMSLSSIQ